MLARVVRSAAQQQQQSAKRAISSSASVAKALQLHPATPSATTSPSPPAVASVSDGELAWCEIYGVDYEQQVQEALEDSPLLVSDVHRATPPSLAKSPRAAATLAKGDIWNVVFGASS